MPAREWDAVAYHKLSNPQFAWGVRVLDSLKLSGNERILDAGCGSGRLTEVLASRVTDGHIIGMDLSVQMCISARNTLSAFPQCNVVNADLLAIPFSLAFDIVVSTATFHWVSDHDRLFHEVLKVLKPGGLLHAQAGAVGNIQSMHDSAAEVMESPAFAEYFADWCEPWVFAGQEETVKRLERAGFISIDVSLEDRPTDFGSETEFADFLKTVVLRPHLAVLPDELRSGFLHAAIAANNRAHFENHLDYRRLNISARKPT